ncbi:MAG: RloB family protein [Chloroflexota bacterium]|nr:RloB family protein [Chloroflexota bacterium]MDE2951925.1 RloB family protein [Chloroflexota bacterium]
MPKLRSRPFARKSKFRDAKAIVIATEGELTEPIYFEKLALDERFRNPRVVIKVLPTTDGRSAPNHIIRRLDDIKRKHGFYEGDKLWLVFDKDDWEDGLLSEVARQANQKGYCLADSNPCFEVWLTMHFASIHESFELSCSGDSVTCDDIIKRLKQDDMDPSYRKSRIDKERYFDRLETAIQHAKLSDIEPKDRYLNQIGSRVYKLAQSIINSSPSNP